MDASCHPDGGRPEPPGSGRRRALCHRHAHPARRAARGPAPGGHAATDGGGLRRGRGRDQTADKVPALDGKPLGPEAAVLFLSGGGGFLPGSQRPARRD